MYVYRITLTKYANSLYASGYAARWNSKGTRLIYTAQSRALACLENLVHRGGRGVNAVFSTMKIEIPDNTSIKKIRLSELPESWPLTSSQSYQPTRMIGDQWIQASTSCILKVPSALIKEEYNYLLNPAHPDFTKIKVVSVTSFSFDERL